MSNKIFSRREALKLTGLASAGLLTASNLMSFKTKETMLLRAIPSSNVKLPVVGLGTWQTFDVGNSSEKRTTLIQVLAEMQKLGGSVIDSSPMYGSSEKVVGDLTAQSGFDNKFFYATKVWTSGKEAGINQMERSFKLMRRKQMDLMQIHNLVDWKIHVKTLKEWKERGKIEYWGITHYVDSSHSSLEKIIHQEKPDFVQFNYSIKERHAEKSLFETVRKNGTAVLINQPYDSGSLFRITRGKQLPEWCKEYTINSWGQYFLKFILSNELVTCVIPGTSKPHHVIDNMMAGYGKMPDAKTREKMHSFIKSI